MARPLAQIEQEIRELQPSDQEELLRVLLEELDGPSDSDVEKAWGDEADRRVQQIDSGAVQCIPADKVFSEIEVQLKK